MDIAPNLTANLDQMTAALRDAPQSLLSDFSGSTRSFALHMRGCGIPMKDIQGLLHGHLVDVMHNLEAECGDRR